jgi:hypothetical protein
MCSHMFLLFLLLLSYSSIFAKSLLTNFFAPFSAAWESDILSHFLYPWHSKLVRRTCAPMFLAQNVWVSRSKTLVGLVVASLPVNFTLFRLLPKVSGVNDHWTEHESYLSYSLKSSN